MYLSRRPQNRVGLGALLDSGAAGSLAAAIQQMEGYYPGSLAYKNNNPGNLMFVGQAGAVRAPDGFFASFPSYDAGYQALLSQLENYAGRGLTIGQMMNIYAPAGHGSNDPGHYADFVAGKLGVSVNTPLTQLGGGGGDGAFDDVFSSDTAVPDLAGAGMFALSADNPFVWIGGALLVFGAVASGRR